MMNFAGRRCDDHWLWKVCEEQRKQRRLLRSGARAQGSCTFSRSIDQAPACITEYIHHTHQQGSAGNTPSTFPEFSTEKTQAGVPSDPSDIYNVIWVWKARNSGELRSWLAALVVLSSILAACTARWHRILTRTVRFQWKNPKFPILKKPHFLMKNPDFLFKNPDFRHQESWFPIEKCPIL